METSWKSIVARAIEEISVSLLEYIKIEENIKKYYCQLRDISELTINSVVVLRKSLDARKSQIKYNIRLEIFTENDWPPELKLPIFKDLQSESPRVHIIGFGPA